MKVIAEVGGFSNVNRGSTWARNSHNSRMNLKDKIQPVCIYKVPTVKTLLSVETLLPICSLDSDHLYFSSICLGL